jgi:UDP-3-O-[3-hydroxymyristoyl] N-acetylglucosamine deacetylase
MSTASNAGVSFAGRGVTSRQLVSVEVEQAAPGRGIVFAVRQGGAYAEIPARWDFVVNTLRNVVLGAQGVRLLIVEHFLAAASLWGLDDLVVRVDGLEMPLGDGSALFWIELFKTAGWERKTVEAHLELKEPVIVSKGERLLMAVPDDRFSMSYHMDWDHPLLGKRWQGWDASMDPAEIASARTFGSFKEHQLLGLADEVVSLTETGFTQELRFQDEPVRHKLLDLLGDLRLSGVNPMRFKARFLSIKAGHELDVELARRLSQAVLPKP